MTTFEFGDIVEIDYGDEKVKGIYIGNKGTYENYINVILEDGTSEYNIPSYYATLAKKSNFKE